MHACVCAPQVVWWVAHAACRVPLHASTHTCMHACTHARMHACTRTHTHMHAHKHNPPGEPWLTDGVTAVRIVCDSVDNASL